jgi:hypothetical protein
MQHFLPIGLLCSFPPAASYLPQVIPQLIPAGQKILGAWDLLYNHCMVTPPIHSLFSCRYFTCAKAETG